ncbi:Hypothetical predicted protein [Octopus vulgaris]|uniref:Uncharacterized protein n=1 Tax=Octopus vulgaris TaxID=6645 RepID=A0AA36B8I9_OCTVU|nr:Hypothetical predicted protein [Octopus vulgaris]
MKELTGSVRVQISIMVYRMEGECVGERNKKENGVGVEEEEEEAEEEEGEEVEEEEEGEEEDMRKKAM